MIQIRNIAKLGLLSLLASYNSPNYAATIIVNTTDMAIDVAGHEFINLDTSGFDLTQPLNKLPDGTPEYPDGTPLGRSGLYKANSLTIADLSSSDNPNGVDGEPAISLPEAIIAANNTPGADTIVLAVGETYTLSSIHNYWYGPNALPPITSSIAIRGDGLPEGVRPQHTDKGAIIQRAPSAPKMRLFFVMGGSYSIIVTGKAQAGLGSLSLENLHIKNGYALGGSGSGGGAGLGGAIFNQGLLSISGVTFSNNTARGGDGSNTAGLGGGGVGGDGVADLGGGFFSTEFIGSEQFIHPSDSTLDTYTSIFGGNGGPGGSGGFGPSDDNGANGGGPAASTSTHDSLGAFGAGGGRAANTLGEDGNAGAFASGGGYGVIGGAGGFGGGGGQGSSSSNDSTPGFAGGKGTSDRGGGGAGLGGAIFNHAGLVAVQNSTFSENEVIGGNGDFGGSAYGAAIFSINAPTFNGLSGLRIIHSTIFNNTCSAGTDTNTDGACDSPVYIMGIVGSGVQDGFVDATATIANTIIANPEAVSYASLSNNKLGGNSGSTLTLSGKNVIRQTIFNGIDATLDQNIANTINEAPFPNSAGMLADNGGPTDTILPLNIPVVSPVIDAADNNETLTSSILFDQRRNARFKDTPGVGEDDLLIADIGAVETGINTAPEITLPTEDVEVTDSSSTRLNFLLAVSDADDVFQQSALDMQLDLAISDGNGTLNIATEIILAIRDSGLEFVSNPTFTVGSAPPPLTVSLSSISLKAPLLIISSVLSQISFVPADGLGSGADDFSELDITIDDLGNSGDLPVTNLSVSDTLQINISGVAPSVGIINSTATTNNTAFPLLILFSEPVEDFDASHIKTSNATIVGGLITLTEKQFFQVYIQPNTQGDIQVEIPADVVEDPIGLKNTASNIVTIAYDVNKPTINITGTPATIGDGEFTTRFVFDEDVSGFSVEDIKVSNASLSEFAEVDASTYTVLVTPNQISGIRFSIKENIAADAAGNGNKAFAGQLIPLQGGGGGSSGSSYNPLFSLIVLVMYLIRRKVHAR